MKVIRGAVGALVLLSSLAVPALAGEVRVGDLVMSEIYARATPPGAPVGGGYMTIRNSGASSDRLVGGEASFAGRVEVHEMKMQGDVMRMRELQDGLEIPAGGEVELKPGGYHIMFLQLSAQLKPGESRPAILRFQNAGEVEVDFDVREVMAGRGGHKPMH